MICGIVVLAVTGYFSGQIALSHLIFVVLFLGGRGVHLDQKNNAIRDYDAGG